MSHETNIVGALLQDARYLDEVLDQVRPDQFAEAQAKKSMLAIVQAAAEGLTPDLPTIAERTRDAGVDPVWLSKTLEEAIPSNAAQYARELARNILRRQYQALAVKVANKSKELVDPEDLAEELEAGLETLSAGHDQKKNSSAEAVAERYLRHIADFKEKRKKLLPCHTIGLANENPSLAILPYWFGGLSVILSAYTTSGKSAYAINLALTEAEAGANVIIFSNEMGEYSYVDRAIGYYSGIPYGQVRHHRLNDLEKEKTDAALLRFSSLPIHVVEPAYTAETIARRLRRMQYTFRPDIVIVDYLQNLRRRPGETTYESLSRQSEELIELAKKHEFSVVMVSQVDNTTAREGDPTKNIMSVKGSGDPAADCDIFIELLRNSIDASKERHITRIVRKNRVYGRTGKTDLWFNRAFTRILDYEERVEPVYNQAKYD